ncbi:MAG: hypothetical protein V3V08_08140 [Nannocystaceae bacterium]
MSERNYQQLVDYLVASNWPICEAEVEAVQIKGKATKITLVVEGDFDLHALADAAGGTVLLVVSGPVGKPADGDVRQDDLFVPGQEADGEKPQAAPSAAFNPALDMPPDDDLSAYENPLAGEDDEGFFEEQPNKPPLE